MMRGLIGPRPPTSGETETAITVFSCLRSPQGWGVGGQFATNQKGDAMQHRRLTTTGRIRGTTPDIEAAARTMRWNQTPAEARLWQALSGRKLSGLKFRRQHPVGSFVLDFFCPACKLVIELDGDVHDGQEAHDAARTEKLIAYGYSVIRLRNKDVLDNLDQVLTEIEVAAFPEN